MSFPYWTPNAPKPQGEIEGFLISDLLFDGPFSLVYRATAISGAFAGQQFALKFVKHRQNSFEAPAIDREIQLLKSLRHPYIVPIVADFRYGPYHCIVSPYAKYGSLERYLTSFNRQRLTLDQAQSVAIQLLEAVAHIHAMGIIHCDIKSANVLVHAADKSGLRIWLCDFGIAKDVAVAEKFAGFVGTERFCPPESYFHAGFAPIVDEFAVGVTLYRALTGSFPFDSAKGLQRAKVDAIMRRPEWRGEMSKAANLVRLLMEPKESTRVAALEALRDEWLRPLPETETCARCTTVCESARPEIVFAR